MKHIGLRIKTAFDILFNHEHALIISLNSEEFGKFLTDDDWELEVRRIGLQKHNVNQIIESVYHSSDIAKLALDKAEFEAELELRKNEHSR